MSDSAAVDHVLHATTPAVCVDRPTLARLLQERPHPEAVVPLLSSEGIDTVRAAVLYLGVYGTLRECALLALCLHHTDEGVAELAEYGLWRIWMQAGSRRANQDLAAAIDRIRAEDFDAAIAHLTQLTMAEPSFAEAHFQYGLALCLAGRLDDAIASYRVALGLNPYHFAAAAALGHAHVEQDNLADALGFYRRALRIHPGLKSLREAIRDLETMIEPWQAAN